MKTPDYNNQPRKPNDVKLDCRPLPFWSWNGVLDEKRLIKQINWMHEAGIGGFFMHARGGLRTPYMGEQWFKCVEACEKEAKRLGMLPYAYDENGWPSGFAGGALLNDIEDHDCYLLAKQGPYDPEALVSYDVSSSRLVRVTKGNDVLNVYKHYSTSTTDICNPDLVRRFIKITHEEYKKHDIYKNLKGFFTDEPQYYRQHTPFTKMLLGYFKERYDEDILDNLGLLFIEKEGYRGFRYKYWKAMNELLTESFGKQVYEWCDSNGYELTGHYIEESSLGYQLLCCGGIMPLYEYEHIPGIDWLGRNIGANDLAPLQLTSVADQLGKQKRLAEIFALAGWDTTPLEYKHIADWLFVNGVNLICSHLLPYEETKEKKRDYPAHFSPINPWVKKGFKEFNDYYSELGSLLASSHKIVKVGFLHPIRSAYFDYKRELAPQGYNIAELDKRLSDELNEVMANQIPIHLLDETILLKHGYVNGNKLRVGGYEYEAIILPSILTMDVNTEKLLKEYIGNGGKVLLLGEKPSFLEGEPFSYPYLKTNIDLSSIKNLYGFKASFDKDIRLAYYENDEGRFFYIVNLSKEQKDFSLNNVSLHFDQYGSKLIYEKDLKDEKDKTLPYLCLNKNWEVEGPIDNYMLLENVELSFDGEHYEGPFNYMGAFMELVRRKVNGEIYLRYFVDVNDIPSNIKLITEYEGVSEFLVNGSLVKQGSDSSFDEGFFETDVSSLIKKGRNEFVFKMMFHLTPNAYECLFTNDVLENIKNSLSYLSTVEAIYLKGDFGVKGDFKKGKRDDILLGENFSLVRSKRTISSLIEDGYPFLRGDICLKQTIEVNSQEGIIRFNDRFHIIDLFINDKFVKRMMFDKEVDVSPYLKEGKNEVKIILTVSNRNLLGPFHLPDQEPNGVGPNSWELLTSWDKGVSSFMIKETCLVKTIL